LIKPEEAALLFSKWRDERTRLHVMAWVIGGFFSVDCRVDSFDGEAIRVRLSDEIGICEFVVRGCFFEYGESPPDATETAGRKYGAVVVAFRPPTERLFFMEVVAGRGKLD